MPKEFTLTCDYGILLVEHGMLEFDDFGFLQRRINSVSILFHALLIYESDQSGPHLVGLILALHASWLSLPSHLFRGYREDAAGFPKMPRHLTLAALPDIPSLCLYLSL